MIEKKDLLDARYIDEARRKYDDLEGTIKNLVVRYVSLQAILHNVKAYYQDVIQYTKDLDDAYTDVAISMDILVKNLTHGLKMLVSLRRRMGKLQLH